MRNRAFIWSLALIGPALVVWSPARGAAPYDEVDLRALQESFAMLARQVRPSVVAIRAYVTGGNRQATGESIHGHVLENHHGSGVILRSDGYILTNDHVVAAGDRIDVVLHNGDEYEARIIQSDARSDLAVIKIDAQGLRPAQLGNAATVQPGHWSFTLGNPFGLANGDGKLSFSVGNITAVDKSLTTDLDPTERRYYGDLIQTSSEVKPGTSGGPLFNLDGEVVGICAVMVARGGVSPGSGFAIPVGQRTRPIIASLLRGEEVRYGYLGVHIRNVTPAVAVRSGMKDVRGAHIASMIDPGTPAARAGLRAGDIIIEFDGISVEGPDHLIRLVGATPINRLVEIVYIRGVLRKKTRVRIVERPQRFTADSRPVPQAPQRTYAWGDLLLGERPGQIHSMGGVPHRARHLVVLRVRRPSRAYEAGLRPGAVITRYNGQRVASLEAFHRIDQTAAKPARLEFRDGRSVRLRK
jgi:serine protease Do